MGNSQSNAVGAGAAGVLATPLSPSQRMGNQPKGGAGRRASATSAVPGPNKGALAGDGTTHKKLSAASPRGERPETFMWYKPGWEAYLDDTNNVYYFNELTCETRWDPFIDANGDPTGQGQLKKQVSGLAKQLSASWNAFDEFAARKEEQEKKKKLVLERADKIRVDKKVPWKELTSTAKAESHTMEKNVAASDDVILQVSQGLYDPNVVFKLPWAYKMTQLAAAAKACYLEGGDFYDSSKYDDCNGVPRYAKGGLVEWYEDLMTEYCEVQSTMATGCVGQESNRYSEAMSALQGIAANGTDDEILKGFVARLKEVETEINNLRSRCYAVVSVEGGPSRESLDTMYRYLKQNVKSDTNLLDIQDEMEEVISNAIEQRHRFMVDILLLMGLLEEESEALNKRIINFQAAANGEEEDDSDNGSGSEEESDGDGDVAGGAKGGGGGEGDNADSAGAGGGGAGQEKDGIGGEGGAGAAAGADADAAADAAEADADAAAGITPAESKLSVAAMSEALPEEVAALLSAQHAQALKLQDSLQARRDAHNKRLEERLRKRRGDRVTRLVAQGIPAEDAELLADAELEEERGAESEAIDRDLQEQETGAQISALMDLVDKTDKAADGLEAEEEGERRLRLAALQQDVERVREGREVELLAMPGISGEEAHSMAGEEADHLLEEGEYAIDQSLILAREAKRLGMLHLIKDRHDKEIARLEQEARFNLAKQKKALGARIEMRKKLRANELMQSGLRPDTALDQASVEAKSALQEAESELEENTQRQIDASKRALLESMHDANNRENARLAKDLSDQEARRKHALGLRLEEKQKRRVKILLSEGIAPARAQQIASEETRAEDSRARAALDAELAEKRASHSLEAGKLLSALNVKKSGASKDLQERLARKKKDGQAKAAAAGGGGKAKGGGGGKDASEGMGDTLTPAKRMEMYLTQMREQHRNSMNRLKQFIEKEKRLALRHCESNETISEDLCSRDGDDFEGSGLSLNRAGSSASNADMNAGPRDLSSSLADVALLFTLVKEGLQTGFKKQCVYEIRAVKDSGNMRPLNPAERLGAVKDGTSQLIMRYARENKSLMELQLAEKYRTRQKLMEDGAPPSKIAELENRFHARLLEAVRKQQAKAIMSICGLTLDMALLAPPLVEEQENLNDLSATMRRQKVAELCDADDIDLDEEDLDEIGDAFSDDDVPGGLSAGRGGKASFQPAVLDWFNGVMNLQKQYAKPPHYLLRRLKAAMCELLEEIEDDETPVQGGEDEFAGFVERVTDNQGRYVPDDVEAAISVSCAAGSISFRALLEAFLGQVNDAARFSRGVENGAVQATMSSVREAFSASINTPEIEASLGVAYKAKDAREIIQTLYKDQMNEFFSDIFSFKENIAAPRSLVRNASDKMIAKEAVANGNKKTPKVTRSETLHETKKREEQLFKALEAKVEKKRRQLQDTFERAREGRGGQCSAQEEGEYADMQSETMEKLQTAYEEIRNMVSVPGPGPSSTNELMNIVSAEGLLAAIEKKLEGHEVGVRDLKTIQSEVEKDLERREATRLRKVQSVEAEKLDVMLKVQKAREQQTLQKRLLARKKKNNGGPKK
jgi:hypothetical protein